MNLRWKSFRINFDHSSRVWKGPEWPEAIWTSKRVASIPEALISVNLFPASLVTLNKAKMSLIKCHYYINTDLSIGFDHVVSTWWWYRGVDVFVDAVEQPQQELQSIVLGIPSELRAVLGHNRLEIKRQHTSVSVHQKCFHLPPSVSMRTCLSYNQIPITK